MNIQKWWIKWPLIILAIIVVLVLITPLIPLGFLKPAVESRLSNSLGRKVTVESLRLNILGGPYLTINNMSAKEDPAFGDGDFLKAEKVRADFSLLQYLFHGRLVINSLSIQSPNFTLIKTQEGVWSWTTIGQNDSDNQPAARANGLENTLAPLATLAALFDNSSGAKLSDVHVEGASVRLVNLTKEQPSEKLYKNISLHASVSTTTNGPSSVSRHTTGELQADSNENDGAQTLRAALPFDLNIKRDPSTGLVVDGTVGPGPFETANFSARQFKITGQINSPPKPKTGQPEQSSSGLRGQGHISCAEVVLPRVNISEKIASKLQIPAVGDTSPGTTIASIETDFQIDQGTYRTPGLQVKNLDGVGDATADQGWFKIESGLILNYNVTITVSDQLKGQIKSTNPVIGAAVEAIESNVPLAVALNITGDARSPEVKVDLLRTFGF